MKKEFKTESKRLLDLMANSIYTNTDIFLRELISNASDALDKKHYLSLTDTSIKADNPYIRIDIDKDNRKLTISDNGIGMNDEDLEEIIPNNKETKEKSVDDEDDTLENDLFELIDSMYDNREDGDY